MTAGSDGAATATELFSRSVSFTDPGSVNGETYFAVISYGDSSSDTTIASVSPSTPFTITHTFATPGNYTVTVKVYDSATTFGSATFGVAVAPSIFNVTSLTSNFSGFDLTFNRDLLTSSLALYDASVGLGATPVTPDLSVTDSSGHIVRGSAVYDAASRTFSFVKTGGELAAGTYTVTVTTGVSTTTPGEHLASNFVGTFTINALGSSKRQLLLGDVVRGPNQTLSSPTPVGTLDDQRGLIAGLPVSIDNGQGIQSVDFEVAFNASDLNLTGATIASGMPSGWTVTTSLIHAGLLRVTVSGPLSSPLGIGARTLVELIGSVPSTAGYDAGEIIRLQNIVLGGTPGLTARGDAGLHKVAFDGDVTSDGTLSSQDAADISTLVARSPAGVDSFAGFKNFALTDGALLADVNGDGSLTGLDASYVDQKVLDLQLDTNLQPEIPDPSVVFSHPTLVADPAVSLNSTTGNRGSTVDTVLSIDNTDMLQSIDMVIGYNAGGLSRLTISSADITLDSFLSSQGWSIQSNIDAVNGRIAISVFGPSAFTVSVPADLVHFRFHVSPTAVAGATSLNIDTSTNPRTGVTFSRLNEGQLTTVFTGGSVTVPIAVTITPDAGNNHLEGSPQTYTGAIASDSATGAVGYVWSVLKDGVSYSITNNTSDTFTFTPDDNALYTVTLVVTDSTDATGTTSAATTINNVAPTVSVNLPSVTVNEGQTAANTGDYSDPGVDVVTVTASAGTITDNHDGTFSWSYPSTDGPDNSRTVTITATDSDGGITTTTFDLVVSNVAPAVAITGAASVSEGSAYTLSIGAITDPGADTVASYLIHWGDGGTTTVNAADLLAAGGNVQHTYVDGPHTYAITVDLTDEDGSFTDKANPLFVSVTDAVPAPTITGTPASSPEATALALTAHANDPGAIDTFTYQWSATKDGNSFAFPGSVNTAAQTLNFTPADFGAYVFTVLVTDNNGASASASASVNVSFVANRITQFTPTASGFKATFIRDIDLSTLNLYSGQNSAGLLPDITLTGPHGAVYGTIAYDPNAFTLTFVATGGVLSPGDYNVVLKSGVDNDTSLSNGFIDRRGGALDGNADGTPGDNFTSTFTVAATVTMTLPDFARGPDQPVNVPAQNLSAGLPIKIQNAMGATQVTFTLSYNHDLLNVSTPVPTLAGWTITSQTSTADSITLTLTLTDTGAGSAISTNDLTTLVSFSASVPSAAEYGAVDLLTLSDITTSDGTTATAGLGDSAIHALIYLGDATGNQNHSALDASKIARVVVGLDTGFDGTGATGDPDNETNLTPVQISFLRIDPTIIGDVTGDGTLSGLDAAFVLAKSVGIEHSEIPNIPTSGSLVFGPTNQTFSVDSSEGTTVTIGSAITHSGGSVSLPISLDISAGLQAADFTLSFDPSLLTIAPNGVTLGSSLPAGWQYVTNIDNAAGSIRVSLYSTTPLTGGATTLLNLQFTAATVTTTTTTSVLMVNDPATASRLNEGQMDFTANAGSVTIDTDPPIVTGVFVSSSSWQPAFTDYLASSGLDNSANTDFLTYVPHSGTITVGTPAPEPASLALLGLLAPLVLRRRTSR